MPRARKTAVGLVAAMLLLAGLLVGLAPPAAAAGLTATFTKTQDWGTGFEGRYDLVNDTGATVTGWQVEFDLLPSQRISSLWDGRIQSNANDHYVVTDAGWNATLAPGGRASFGFVGAYSGTWRDPANCTVNGASCDGGGGSTTTTPPSTVPPTTTPPTTSPPTTSPPTTTPPTTSPPTTTPPTTGPPPPTGEITFAPYIDITRPEPSMADVARQTGQRDFTLAFVLGSSAGCEPAWGGTIPLDDPRIIGDIRELQALGGDVVIASGGALGPYLEHVCGSAGALADAYEEVLDLVGSNHLDLDIEASINNDLVNQALALLQQRRPATEVGYTLRVLGDDFGLDPSAVAILRSAVANGVDVDVVNPMVMNFGSSRPTWGEAMIAAAESTLGQMRGVFTGRSDAELRRMLGATAMIGRNDTGPVTRQSDARALVSWANQNNIGFLSFWSVGRDNGGCPDGRVSPSCSGIAQSEFEFTGIFGNFQG